MNEEREMEGESNDNATKRTERPENVGCSVDFGFLTHAFVRSLRVRFFHNPRKSKKV